MVVVPAQPSTVVQSVPSAAATLNLPRTRQSPGRRRERTRSRRPGAVPARATAPAAHAGRPTVSVVVIARRPAWLTVAASPDRSTDAGRRPRPGLAVRRTLQRAAASHGALRPA